MNIIVKDIHKVRKYNRFRKSFDRTFKEIGSNIGLKGHFNKSFTELGRTTELGGNLTGELKELEVKPN